MSQRDEGFAGLPYDRQMFAGSDPFGFRGLPYMLRVVGASHVYGLSGRPPYPAAALEPEADTAQNVSSQSSVVVLESDGLDADSVEHERMMRRERWQRQR